MKLGYNKLGYNEHSTITKIFKIRASFLQNCDKKDNYSTDNKFAQSLVKKMQSKKEVIVRQDILKTL